MVLRRVPHFASAHTFCASRNGPKSSVFLRTAPTNLKVFFFFCAIYHYAGKEDLRKVY